METTTAKIPHVEVRITANAEEGIWRLEFDCPWCPPKRGRPRQHFHGGGTLDSPVTLGHRNSHCLANGAPDGYELVAGGEDGGLSVD